MNAWTHFATFGNTNVIKQIKWNAVERTEDPLRVVNINNRIYRMDLPNAYTIDFWTSLPKVAANAA